STFSSNRSAAALSASAATARLEWRASCAAPSASMHDGDDHGWRADRAVARGHLGQGHGNLPALVLIDHLLSFEWDGGRPTGRRPSTIVGGIGGVAAPQRWTPLDRRWTPVGRYGF